MTYIAKYQNNAGKFISAYIFNAKTKKEAETRAAKQRKNIPASQGATKTILSPYKKATA